MNCIDAVWTWVDGNDHAHILKLNNYLKSQGIVKPDTALPTRFSDCGELFYSLSSVLKFAPWIRNLYIVTSKQRPKFLDNITFKKHLHKIHIIDEDIIFDSFDEFLPTFNSISIESLLWRIPGICDNFIYFNDDWCLLREVCPEDFFQDDKIVIRGHWRLQSQFKTLAYYWRKLKKKNLDLYRLVQENSAKIAGFTKFFFELPHIPLSSKKHLFSEIFSIDNNLLMNNIKFAFRSSEQFLPFSLMQHYAIKNRLIILDNNLKSIYIHADLHNLDLIKNKIYYAEKNSNYKFLCMQSLDLLDDISQKYIFNWLDSIIC